MSGGGLVFDSSAVLAILREEPGQRQLQAAVEETDVLAIGAPTLFETMMVALGRFGAEGEALVEQFLGDLKVEVLPFDIRHWRVATDAFIRYGKGRHPAGLNFGDCMSYAAARVADEPLLFTGNDFAKTDIPPA